MYIYLPSSMWCFFHTMKLSSISICVCSKMNMFLLLNWMIRVTFLKSCLTCGTYHLLFLVSIYGTPCCAQEDRSKNWPTFLHFRFWEYGIVGRCSCKLCVYSINKHCRWLVWVYLIVLKYRWINQSICYQILCVYRG